MLGKHTESPGASRISSHRIVGKYQCVQSAGGTVQRAVALHRDMAQAGVVCLEFGLDEFVAIEIDESDFAMREMIPKTRLMQEQLRVAMMPGSFSNGNGSGSQAQERFGSGADQLSVSIDWSPRDVLHQVGLEQDGFPADVQIEKPDPLIDQLVELVGVLVRRKNYDSRTRRTEISRVFSPLEPRG